MKVGLLIPVFNRPEYLRHCIESISRIRTEYQIELLFANDCSTDKDAILLISGLTNCINLMKNKGVSNALRLGFNVLFAKGCDIIINLDSDAIVKPNAIEVLIDLKKRFPNKIISGFNTLTTDPKTKLPRHPILRQFDNHCIKKSIGGINMVITEDEYLEIVLPALKKPGHWDWNVCSVVKEFVVSTPSVVQHIGIDKGMNLNNPDTAFDF